MKKLAVLALAAALTVGSAPAAEIFRSVPNTKGDRIVLTDEKNSLCPSDAFVAFMLKPDGTKVTNLVGCWAYDSGAKTIRVLWMTLQNYNPVGFEKTEDISL